jgi:hypothetical protein
MIILIYLLVTKVLKLKQQAAISFPLQFLKYSLPAVLRGGSRQTTARLGTYLETRPFAFVQWSTETLPLKEADSGNVIRSWKRGK